MDVIRLENVHKSFGDRESLRGVSFLVEQGDLFGYLGSNGAGKTTTIRILLDLLQPSSGEALVLGERVDRSDTRRRLGFVLDADGLYNALSARENLSFYAQIYGAAGDAARFEQLLEMVGLQGRGDERVGGFSKGMRQRLAVARAMVHDPAVLILDEPMSGVDPSGRIALRQILLDLVQQQGKTVLLSSHDLDEVQRTCNRIALIDQGRIRLCGDLQSLLRDRGEGELVVETSAALTPAVQADLRAAPQLGLQTATGSRLVFKPAKGLGAPEVVRFLVEKNVPIEGVTKREATLEEMYRAILAEREAVQ